MNDASPIKEYLHRGMTLDQVVAYCKKYPELVKGTDVGRAILKLIKEGNTKKLRRFWQGKA